MSERRPYFQWTDPAAAEALAHLAVATRPESWRDRAVCAQVDAEVFFPADGNEEAKEEAKRVCAGCDAWFPCLRYAMENNVEHGVWGGLDERERLELRPAPVVAADDREKICTGPCGLPRPLSEFRLLPGRRERRRETWCTACRRDAHRRVAA